jgi:hypothetical protein
MSLTPFSSGVRNRGHHWCQGKIADTGISACQARVWRPGSVIGWCASGTAIDCRVRDVLDRQQYCTLQIHGRTAEGVFTMNRSCTFALFTLVSATFAAPTSAATLSVDLGLALIPSSITLCRDAAVINEFPVDHQLRIGFDLDGNTSTGQPVSGNEAILIVQTLTQSLPCAPQAVPAISAFETGVLRWNASSGEFETAGPATVIVDVPNGRLRMSFDNSVLPAPGMGSIAGIDATSFAGYSSSGVMYANDVVPRFTRGTSPSITVSDPANDVAGCVSLCSTASSWYPLVDMRSLQIGAATDLLFSSGFE